MEIESLKKRQLELAKTLLEKRNPLGFWEGRLSSSALGVAVAVTAFHFNDAVRHQAAIKNGVGWLIGNQNSDGGYGDTPESVSNISTSLLVYAAFNIQYKSVSGLQYAMEKLSTYFSANSIDINSPDVATAILAHYKTDYTFSVPILTMCALCGIPSGDSFRKIPQLPFEPALLPRSLYKVFKLSVVSYAIPALIAVGIAIYTHKQKKNPITSWFRKKAIAPALRLLRALMPDSGGFLEAIPLTAFVSISLIASGHGKLEVVEKGIRFLLNTQREDGSWPIDVDLSTWVTTLSVKALKNVPEDLWNENDHKKITSHLLGQQYAEVHPFNGAMPGGWGWTNHSGSVPDGDDTPGAIIALLLLNRHQPEKVKAVVLSGCNWLLNLRNSDGGFPTFVRGWGKLPFDQSCADLTGHGILALSMTLEYYKGSLDNAPVHRYEKVIAKGTEYLLTNQRPNGALLPLWFGNQYAESHHNPVYGTARVLTYLNDMTGLSVLSGHILEKLDIIVKKGQAYLRKAQNADGSWGGDTGVTGTIEETSLALSALAGTGHDKECKKALVWLDQQYQLHGLPSSPIGLYFASLWYDEELYPHTAYLEGIGRYLESIY